MKFINFEHAKKVAMTGLAMTSCGFLLWVSQGTSHADDTPTTVATTTQAQQTNTDGTTTQQQATANTANNQTATANTQMQVAASQSYNRNDKGNYANMDSISLNPDGSLNATGWHATNGSEGRPYHYIIALNQDNHEIARQNITDQEVTRNDVQQVHNVYGASQSGFNVHFDLSKVMGSTSSVTLISRYTSDPLGNTNDVDYYFAPVTIDRRNYASLDDATVTKNQLEVTGWNATNLAVNKPNHYIILLDRTTGREVARQLVKDGQSRPDVAKVYPGVEGAGQSGFDVFFNLNGVNFNHKLQLLSRYTSSKDGNSDYVDYYFTPITNGNYANQGNLDSFNLSSGHLNVVGWHANDISKFENQRYVIIYDNTANSQVASQKVDSVSRTDVAKAYPSITTAGQSGFNANFDLGGVKLVDGHSYSVVSRYSTSTNGDGDDGQYTDFWSSPVVYHNQQAYSIDQIKMTDQGLQLAGWMASSQSQGKGNAYVIILNGDKEVARQKLSLTSRPDVAKVYPLIYNSANSGFNTLVKFNPAEITGNMRIVLRFTDDPAGNGNNTADQWLPDYSSNQGKFDDISINGSSVYVSGWHASDQSANKPYQYLIFLDANGHEVYRQRVLDINRASATAAATAPYILHSANSGYQLGLTLPASAQGKVFQVIHRFTDDINGNGNFIDLRSEPLLQYNMTANAINRYILQNKVGHASIQTDYVIPEVTGKYSNTSDGRPDMVVVHETANPNDSIYGEINFEKQHYNNAFVHAFVDGNNIIEVSSTDREAWGAGYPANGRAVQFEQVEVYGAGNFVRELVNGAYYAAYKMKQYGIVPTLAWYNSQTGQYGGTLWSHHMVSEYMHVTDHTDPDGYWARRASQYFGTTYTMSDFFELVKYEYRQL